MSFYVGSFDIEKTIVCHSNQNINGSLLKIKSALILKNGTTRIADIDIEISNCMKINNIKLMIN